MGACRATDHRILYYQKSGGQTQTSDEESGNRHQKRYVNVRPRDT